MEANSKSAGAAVINEGIPALVLEDVMKAVDLLSSKKGVTRIWLFGSASRKRPLDWRSDLDFAVEGLPAGGEYRAWSELDELLSRPLDLVRCEDASPLLLSEIHKGLVLHES